MKLPKFSGRRKSQRKLFVLRRVTGDSMLPALLPGAIVVGVWPRNVFVGDVVIMRHNGLDKIKRVKALRPGELFLTGDNSSHSTDSRNFGWLGIGLVVAKVVWPRTARTED